MTDPTYTCPACSGALELYANGDNGAHQDRWSCGECGVEYPHTRFPLPAGYATQARLAERAQQTERERAELASWNRWASNKAAQEG